MIQLSGHGNTNAPAILVADGGTESDVAKGYALTGDQEAKLKFYCHSNHIGYDELWRTALIKERINARDTKTAKLQFSDEYKEIILNEVRSIGANVIVPLGELSFNFFSGLDNIRKFRGSVLSPRSDISIPASRIIPTLGPNPYIYEDPKQDFITRIDFGKVKSNLDIYGPIPEVGLCWVAKTAEQFREFKERHYANASYLVFDIETFANIPTCISFCFDGNESCCVPLLDRSLSKDVSVLLFMEVAKLLASPIPKVNQNIKFDWKNLERVGFYVNNVQGDTVLAASCLYAEFPKNLGFLTSIYTDMPYFKDEGKEYDPSIHNRERLYLYCAKDSLSTHKIYSQQQPELAEQGVDGVYKNLITLLPIYKEMEQTGILIDDTQRKILLAKYTSLFDIYCEKLRRLTGEEINPLSSVRVAKLVYDELQFRVIQGIKRNKERKDGSAGNYKADEDSLELLMWKSDSPVGNGKIILRTIIDCRKIHKVIEILVLPLHPDGRFRCEFNLAGTETGRTSAGETTDYHLKFVNGKVKMINLGHSLQTIGKHGFEVDGQTYGKDIRSIFVPSPGYSFVECDLSQAEARVDAVLACDFDILPVFDGPIGIHRLTGSWVYGCDPKEIKKNDLVLGVDRYHEAKTVRHAGERNMKEERLMMMIRQEISHCTKILKVFHDNQPNIRGIFHKEIREKIKADRVLIAPNGRRRDFFGRIDDHTVNEGISFLPQAIVTDYLKDGIRASKNMFGDFVRPLAEAHDGFFTEVKIGREMEYGRAFKANVEQEINFETCSLSRDFRLKIPCEIATGRDWLHMDEVKE